MRGALSPDTSPPYTSGASQGLTRNVTGGAASMHDLMLLSRKAMKLKLKVIDREVSERRQVGDVEDMVNEDPSAHPLALGDAGASGTERWWRNVGMEEGM